MIRKRTKNQLASTPMRMPKIRASWIELPPNMRGDGGRSHVPDRAAARRRRGSGNRPRVSSQRWTLLAVCLGTFMLLLDITVVNVALPDIQRELDASFTDLQWVVDAYSLMLASVLLTAGSLADLFGRRRVFAIGLVLFSLASLLCGLSGTPTVLNLARGFQGLGGAVMFACAPALIAQEYQGRERASAFGVWGATIGAAVAVGPLVGGVLTEHLGWEWIFFVNVPDRRADGDRDAAEAERVPPGDARAHRLGGRRDLQRRALLPRVRPDPRQRRGLGQRDDPRPAGRLGGAPDRLRVLRAARVAADARPRALPQAGLHRRPDRRLLDLGVDVLDVPLPHALHAERAQLLAVPGGPALPARVGPVLLGRPARRAARQTGAGARADLRRARGRRHRACCSWAASRPPRRGPPCWPASSSRAPASASSTPRSATRR